MYSKIGALSEAVICEGPLECFSVPVETSPCSFLGLPLIDKAGASSHFPISVFVHVYLALSMNAGVCLFQGD